jgi:hypothetical protein
MGESTRQYRNAPYSKNTYRILGGHLRVSMDADLDRHLN